jgi:tetratricopeptide (TPR) repeat protein
MPGKEMRSFRLPPRIVSTVRLVLLGTCTFGGVSLADPPPKAESVATFSSPLSYQVYNVLAAEMYARQGNTGQAALHYMAAAQQARDPKLAQRASELAVTSGDNVLSGRALALWAELDPKSAEARQYRVLTNLRAKNYDEALKDLVAVRDDVEKREGHGFEFIVSLLSLESGDDGTYETFKRYVGKVDGSVRAQLALASMALETGRFAEALKAGEAAKKAGNKQQQEQASRVIADAFMGLKEVGKAVDELEPVVKHSNDLGLKLDFGRMLILSDRRNEATPLYKQLYASQPENSDILYTLGLLYLEQKQYAYAEPLIRKLQQIPDRAADASYFLGQVYEGQKHPQEAIKAYQQALRGSFSAESVGHIVSLLESTQNADAALKWLKEQQAQTGNDDAYKRRLLVVEGKMLHDLGKYQDALACFDQALQLKADDPDALYNRGLVDEKLGRFDAAEADLRALLKQQPDNPTVLNALGYMLVVNTQRYADAEKLIRKALEASPDDAAIMDSMGWVLFRSGKTAEAEKWLRKAYAGLHEPEVAGHLVEVLSAGGKSAEARNILQDMLGQFPDDEKLMSLKDKLVNL